MSETRQYLACKFTSGGERTYTYHNDGEPAALGDLLKVAAPRGEGKIRVEVVSILDEAPPFQTKPILERVEQDDERAA